MLLLMCFHSGEHWGRVFTGLEKSPCPTPCRTFHTKTKFLSSEKEKTEDRFQLRLFFIPEMTITTTDFVEPTISSMLSEVSYHQRQSSTSNQPFQIGGSMGLWLGLGVVQAVQLFAEYLLPLLRRKTGEGSIKVAT